MGSSKKATDASRAERKAKKRRLEDAIAAVPGDDDDLVPADNKAAPSAHNPEGKSLKRKRQEDGQQDGEGAAQNGTKSKKVKEGRKAAAAATRDGESEDPATLGKAFKKKKDRKNADAGPESVPGEAVPDEAEDAGGAAVEEEEVPVRKSKKDRKAERKAQKAAAAAGKDSVAIAAQDAAAAPAVETTAPDPDDPAPAEGEKKTRKNNRNREKKRREKQSAGAAGDGAGGEGKDPRFIVFVGNLPFSATTASVTKHFASVKPKAVRHLTQKDNPAKSKGIAFVEFEGYDHMKTCLRLLHHSTFDDGISPARKINVELTAGGGGNTRDRRNKIREKNTKLNDERTRRIQEEEKAKWEKAKEAGGVSESAIHPSRRGRVPGAV